MEREANESSEDRAVHFPLSGMARSPDPATDSRESGNVDADACTRSGWNRTFQDSPAIQSGKGSNIEWSQERAGIKTAVSQAIIARLATNPHIRISITQPITDSFVVFSSISVIIAFSSHLSVKFLLGSPHRCVFYLDHWTQGVHSPSSDARFSLSEPEREDR